MIMTTQVFNKIPVQSTPFPNDLSLWTSKSSLVSLVLEAVHEVGGPLSSPPVSGREEFPPAMMRTLLIYCYAIGVFSSREIENLALQDKMARYLCANDFPDWQTIRRFRRQHTPFLKLAMARLFQTVWARRVSEVNFSQTGMAQQILLSPKAQNEFMAEADKRLNRAIHADSMAMDE